MQLKLRLALPRPLTIPTGYGHQLQSAIYYALGQMGLGAAAHDLDAANPSHSQKLFTFGKLHGAYRAENAKLTFFGSLKWEIRSCQRAWIEALFAYYQRAGEIKIFDTYLPVMSAAISEQNILAHRIKIETEAPIFIKKSKRCMPGTPPPSPAEPDGQAWINDNFIRKYTLFFGEAPTEGIRLTPISPPKSVCVRYKKDGPNAKDSTMFFSSWEGTFLLEGAPDALTFLYDVGLGGKNSCGLGMFRLT